MCIVIFALYDFDETALLTLDEMVLAFRSTLSGLSKLSQVDPPSEAEVEAIVVQGFDALRADRNQMQLETADSSDGIDREAFVNYCLNTPEILSWIEYFDDIEEIFSGVTKVSANSIAMFNDFSHVDRTVSQEATMHPVIGGLRRLENERKGLAKDVLTRKPWQNIAPFLVPNRAPPEPTDAFPTRSLNMEWVYGYNGHSSRQNLFYSAKGSIIYAAGSVCIVQDVQQHTQKIFAQHNDLVTCLKAFHTPDLKTIVATGEAGRRPAIHIWDADTRTLLSSIQGFHRRGIMLMDFSPDTSRLATMGMDKYHCIAVYNWASKEQLWGSRTTPDPVFDMRFLSATLIGAVGKNHFNFFSEDKKRQAGFVPFRGLFGNVIPENLWCVAAVGNSVVTGSNSGKLYVWEGRNLVDSVKGHSSPILCCYVIHQPGDEGGLVTACSGGKVIVWSSKLEVGAVFNTGSLGAIEPAIISIAWDKPTSKILLGFRSCEIFEIDSFGGRNLHTASLVTAHFSPMVSCLALHPMNPRLVCTVSDDRTVRIFDADIHRQVRAVKLDTMARCCSYSPDGKLILVGLGSGSEDVPERKEGAYVVLSEEDLTIVYEARDSKMALGACKFSPDGDLYALASNDGLIYLYRRHGYAIKVICRGHAGHVTHLDFSQDSHFIMTNSSAGELMFWDCGTGESQAPKVVKELKWATNTCVYSFATQGLWGPHVDGVSCVVACRSHARDLIAGVDDCGRLRLCSAPCTREDPTCFVCYGHGSTVQSCDFTCDDNYFFSSGGTDGSIFQWSVGFHNGQSSAGNEVNKRNVTDDVDPKETDHLAAEIVFHGKKLERSRHTEEVLNDIPIATCLLEEGSIDTNQIQPWQRTIVAPSRIPFEDNTEPPDGLDLEFVYGFTTDRTRQSLMYSPSGEALFFAGSVVIAMEQSKRVQRFYMHHTSTISALAISNLASVVASGDVGEAPTIRVWHAVTMETIAILQGFHRRGICHMKFSSNGKHLVSVGLDKMHTFAVYDWRNSQIVCHSPTCPNRSYCVDFSPNGTELLQVGNEIIRFWKIADKVVVFQDGQLGVRARIQGFLCIGWIGNNAVVGTADGNLYRFVGRQLDGMVKAHEGSITALAWAPEGLCSCSTDGFVKIWTKILDCRMTIDLKTFSVGSRNLRCISWDAARHRILVGTSFGEIVEISSVDGENLHAAPLLQGHGGEELWGLAVNPVKDQFCSVGDDAFLRIWDLLSHSAVQAVQLELASRCCCYNPDGTNIAVGFGSPHKVTTTRSFDGKWVVLDSEDFQVIHEARDSTKWLVEAKFTPSGDLLAFGASDGSIFVYDVKDSYSLSATINQHTAIITGIDFSEDSRWMQSTCAAFELNFFEADTGMFIPAASRLRDTVWASQNCPLSWSTQGLWKPQLDGTIVTACESNLFRSGDGPIMVCGDNYGSIQLFRSPCVSAFAVSKRYRVSSNPVTRLRFCAGDMTLLTLSAADKSIMQWSHQRDRGPEVAWNILERRGAVEENEEDVARLSTLSGAMDQGQALPEDTADILHTANVSKPWLASMVPPTKLSSFNITNDPPKETFAKHHIFGLECGITRSSVRFNSAGDFVFPTSKYVCVFNKKKNSQIFYAGHGEYPNPAPGVPSMSTAYDDVAVSLATGAIEADAEICCVTTSKDGRIVASATRCLRPNIHIWDACSCATLCVLQLLHRRGVLSMQFSDDNKMLVSVGMDQEHSIALWESPTGSWSDGRLLACAKGDAEPVLFCCFFGSSTDHHFLASGGRFHQKFWKLDGRCLNSHYPECEASLKFGTLLCGATAQNKFLSGSSSGEVFVWEGRKMSRIIRAHGTGVTCIWADNGAGVLTSAKDGIVKQWTIEMKHLRSFSLANADVPPILPCIKSLDAVLLSSGTKGRPGDVTVSIKRIVVSTNSGEIYEIAGKSGGTTLVHESHYEGELWGLCTSPGDPDLFATCGDDRTVRVWSIASRRLLRKAVLDCTARSISWSGDGRNLLVGLGGSADNKRQKKDGAWLLLNAESLKPIFEGRCVKASSVYFCLR